MILNAKCHVIRDAQLIEKDIIKREQQQEQRRLDEMMEIERANAIRMEEEIERKRKEERLIGAMKIMEQIEENEKVCRWLVCFQQFDGLMFSGELITAGIPSINGLWIIIS